MKNRLPIRWILYLLPLIKKSYRKDERQCTYIL
jgi:hypothetical protein